MKVKINGKAEEIARALNIAELLTAKGLLAERVVIEHNRRIIAKEDLRDVSLNEDDSLEIVTFVGGG